MANSVHISQKSKVRSHQQKIDKESVTIKKGQYIQDFIIALSFSNDEKQLVDFLPLFQKYVKGDNLRYFAPQNFKKFIVKNGNIYWGKNEDVIFPTQLILQINDTNEIEEEVLFVF